MSTLSDNPQQNIKLVQDLAEAQYPDNEILAQLVACQAILESNLQGKPSQLAAKYNNLFGIKGKGTKGSVALLTTEYNGDGEQSMYQNFAWNSCVEDSFIQHNQLLINGTSDNYARYQNLFTAQTFEDAANLIRLDGYATDPSYTNLLIELKYKYYG